ncbi:MAG TPA: AI-2E family transporter [Solirubrobacterales bacterium]|jgi:predicted PurR-regulated permease PerM
MKRRKASQGEEIEVVPGEFTTLFQAPQWLRNLGIAAWLLVGVAAALAGAVWLLALTQTIVMPVITAAIIAAVFGPAVDWLKKRGLPRGLGSIVVFAAIIAIGVLASFLVLKGISTEADSLSGHLHQASDKIEGYAEDLGVGAGTAEDAKEHADSSVSGAVQALLKGVAVGIDRLASLAVFLSFTALSLFFLLKDAPTIGGWVERHVGLPQPLAHAMLGRLASSLRGYFLGVTIVAAWSALIVGIGSLILGVPLAGTIAAVTFLGGYIPYLGAWAAGAFAVLIALGASGPDTAIALAVIVLLANGIFQQLVQPVAYGAALGLHPLAVLIVTVAAGAMFGTIGLVLAAPLTSAVVKISADIAAGRAEEATRAPAGPAEGAEEPSPA